MNMGKNVVKRYVYVSSVGYFEFNLVETGRYTIPKTPINLGIYALSAFQMKLKIKCTFFSQASYMIGYI